MYQMFMCIYINPLGLFILLKFRSDLYKLKILSPSEEFSEHSSWQEPFKDTRT